MNNTSIDHLSPTRESTFRIGQFGYSESLISVLNIILDLIFIINFHWDVQGAALATIISQGVSGIACLIYMIKKYPLIHASRSPKNATAQNNERKFDSCACRQLCAVGIPMGLQYSITAVGSVILQSSVNTLGSAAVASVTAGQKVSMFFCTVFDALGTTMATYGGQNTGAGKYDRLRTGVRDSMLISIIYSICAFIVFIFAGKYCAPALTVKLFCTASCWP